MTNTTNTSIDIGKGLTDARFPQKELATITILVALACTYLFSTDYFTVLQVNPELSKLGGDVFLKYLFIVIAVERAAAVFVGNYRSQSKVDWVLRINRLNEIVHMDNPPIAVLKQVYARENKLVTSLANEGKIIPIDEVPKSPTNEDYLGYLMSVKHIYEFQRARYNSLSNKYVMRIVFFVGIILAALGLSIFQDIFLTIDLVEAMKAQIEAKTISAQGLEWQTGFVRLADIIITGGLLGGGSAGLNAMATKTSEFLNKT